MIIVPGVGPKPARIMLVGEAPGKDEEEQELPFVGASGRLLQQMFNSIGLDRTSCYITNVIQTRPPNNDIDKFCLTKTQLPKNYPFLPVSKGKYLDPQYIPCLPRLTREIKEVDPNVIVAFGNLSCWALLSKTGVSSLRGFIFPCSLVAGKKVIPAFHPAAVLRSPKEKITLFNDLSKALAQSSFPELRYPNRCIGIEPDLSDIRNWIDENRFSPGISIDIETEDDLITCISFAAASDSGIVIPFKDHRRSDGNYWRSPEEEIAAWKLVGEILSLPASKLFQNGCYDLQFIFRMGLPMVNCNRDTMLKHHSLYQELKKSLGFMGSLYTEESAWKLMHKRSGDEIVKKEE